MYVCVCVCLFLSFFVLGFFVLGFFGLVLLIFLVYFIPQKNWWKNNGCFVLLCLQITFC